MKTRNEFLASRSNKLFGTLIMSSLSYLDTASSRAELVAPLKAGDDTRQKPQSIIPLYGISAQQEADRIEQARVVSAPAKEQPGVHLC